MLYRCTIPLKRGTRADDSSGRRLHAIQELKPGGNMYQYQPKKHTTVRGPLFAILAAAVVFSAAWPQTSPAKFVVPVPASSHLHLTQNLLQLPVNTPSVHAVSLAALPSGRLLAAWFGGSREGSPDVSIFLSRFDGQQWSAPETIATPAAIGAATGNYTRKLGNPLLHVDVRGDVHLFVVCVALGGWSTSTVAHAVSRDGGHTFDSAQRLHLSPLLNFSHLVRAPAINLDDGGFLLPVYFEIGRKYPLMLGFDAAGRNITRHRVPGPPHLLQAALSIHGERDAVAFLRDAQRKRVYASGYENGASAGSWSPSRPIAVENPDSAVAVLPSDDGGHWLACNPESTGRGKLVLVKLNASLAPQETIVAARADDGEVSYPALARTDDGRVHLVYTDHRSGLTHRIFEAPHD